MVPNSATTLQRTALRARVAHRVARSRPTARRAPTMEVYAPRTPATDPAAPVSTPPATRGQCAVPLGASAIRPRPATAPARAAQRTEEARRGLGARVTATHARWT